MMDAGKGGAGNMLVANILIFFSFSSTGTN